MFIFYTGSSSTESPFVVLNRKRSASDWGSIPSRHPRLIISPVIPHLMRDLSRLDSRFHGNDTPLVILNRKQSASDWGSNTSRHPALDTGSSWIWIPACAGMTKGDTGMTEGVRERQRGDTGIKR